MTTIASLQAVPELSATLEDVSSTCSTMTSVPSTHPTTSSAESHTCPYKDCHKSFSKKYNLKAHLRLHTGEQPFQCERPDCRKKFKWRSSLSSHTVWHTRKDNASATPSDLVREANKRDGSVTKSEASVSKASKASPLKAKQKDSTTVRSAARKPPVPFSISAKAETSSASPANKKKRPRIEASRQRSCKSTATTVSQGGKQQDRELLTTTPLCVVPEGICGSNQMVTIANGEHDAPDTKRRRLDDGKYSEPLNGVTEADVAAEDTSSPGSPVTSDGGCTEPALDLDIFTGDMLPPLLGGGEDGLGFEGGDVEAVLSGSNEVDMFELASASCGVLNGLDTRFGAFDLDSLQNF